MLLWRKTGIDYFYFNISLVPFMGANLNKVSQNRQHKQAINRYLSKVFIHAGMDVYILKASKDLEILLTNNIFLFCYY